MKELASSQSGDLSALSVDFQALADLLHIGVGEFEADLVDVTRIYREPETGKLVAINALNDEPLQPQDIIDVLAHVRDFRGTATYTTQTSCELAARLVGSALDAVARGDSPNEITEHDIMRNTQTVGQGIRESLGIHRLINDDVKVALDGLKSALDSRSAKGQHSKLLLGHLQGGPYKLSRFK